MLRNVKAQRYKTKADFSADLDLIWDNCLLYNTQDVSCLDHLRRAIALGDAVADGTNDRTTHSAPKRD